MVDRGVAAELTTMLEQTAPMSLASRQRALGVLMRFDSRVQRALLPHGLLARLAAIIANDAGVCCVCGDMVDA